MNYSRRNYTNAWLIDVKTNRSYQLFDDDTTIGRAYNNDIVINDDYLSRQHALIRFQNKAFVLYPQAATVPIRLNGYIIDGAQGLHNEDHVTMGKTTFRFVVGVI